MSTGLERAFVRKVTITFRGENRDELHVDRADDTVMIALSPEEAIGMALADDKQISKETGKAVITQITWENTPSGFAPPPATCVAKRHRSTSRRAR